MAKEHTGLGIASLVLGIIAILTCFVPTFIFGLVAIILGAISYYGESKDSFGLAGLILGVVSIIINVLVIVMAIAIISSI